MKIAVISSKGFDDYQLMKQKLDQFYKIEMIIAGGEKRIDQLTKKYSQENYINFKKLDKSVPMKTNQSLIETCDLVIAFWDGKSTETKNILDQAKVLNKRVEVHLV